MQKKYDDTVGLSNAVLLHICCGVCSFWPVQKLRDDGYSVIGYFYNPNIQPKEEYEKRLAAAKKVSRVLEFELIAPPYDPEVWMAEVKGYESEKEGGKRCEICYRLRLEATYKKAFEMGIEKFTTTLTVSPHKDSKTINRIGGGISSGNYLSNNFKTENGFKYSHDSAKQLGIYCQNYCGCLFSKR